MKLLKILAMISLPLFLYSCSTSTSYQNVNENVLSSGFSATDQKMLVDQLSEKLINDRDLKEEMESRPTLLVDLIKNKTSEQIDTVSISDTLRVKLARAKLFTIINRDKTSLLLKEQELNQAGLTDKQKATQLGKLWGAQYVIYGNFSSIVNYVNKQKQVYYKLTLTIQNIETGEEVWIDEAELNKVTK